MDQTITFNSNITEIEGKITTAEGKTPDISGLATKTEVTTVENKILDISGLVNKTDIQNVEDKIPDVNGFVKKIDYATEISKMKNDYVTNTALISRLNDLKTTQIADEVKKVDDKTKKNASDILGCESRLKQKVDFVDELRRGDYYYNQQSYLLFEPRSPSFNRSVGIIDGWKSTGVHNDGNNTDLISVVNSTSVLPKLLNQSNRLACVFTGNYMNQNKTAYARGTGMNIYIVCKLQKRTVTSPDFTVQNALFGAVKITKDVNTSHYKCSGYGICFDGNSSFSFGNSLSAKNVIIFGFDMSFSSHANNRVNNIYVLGKDFIHGINGTTIYAEKFHKTDFT